jgi:hypothetical protein
MKVPRPQTTGPEGALRCSIIDACTVSKRNHSLSRRGEGLLIYRETVCLHPIARKRLPATGEVKQDLHPLRFNTNDSDSRYSFHRILAETALRETAGRGL